MNDISVENSANYIYRLQVYRKYLLSANINEQRKHYFGKMVAALANFFACILLLRRKPGGFIKIVEMKYFLYGFRSIFYFYFLKYRSGLQL